MRIRLLELNELEKLNELYCDVVKDMNSRGLYNWNEGYPGTESLKKDVHKQCLYVIEEENGDISAAVSIDNSTVEDYDAVNWNIQGPFYTFHRIAVHPNYTRRGYAKKLISFAEELAREFKCKSMRIDSYHKNENAITLYKSLGYKYVGDISLRNTGEPFYCFEKEIK